MSIYGVEPTGQVSNGIFRPGNNPGDAPVRYSFAIVTKEEWDEAYDSYARGEFQALPTAEKRLRFLYMRRGFAGGCASSVQCWVWCCCWCALVLRCRCCACCA